MSTKKSEINEKEIEVVSATEVKGYICPLTINYEELEAILAPTGGILTDYVGDKLPIDEVQRIERDFGIYLTLKYN